MKARKCDICQMEGKRGMKVRLVGFGWPPWKKLFVCEKCMNTMKVLVRSYRRERF